MYSAAPPEPKAENYINEDCDRLKVYGSRHEHKSVVLELPALRAAADEGESSEEVHTFLHSGMVSKHGWQRRLLQRQCTVGSGRCIQWSIMLGVCIEVANGILDTECGNTMESF